MTILAIGEKKKIETVSHTVNPSYYQILLTIIPGNLNQAVYRVRITNSSIIN